MFVENLARNSGCLPTLTFKVRGLKKKTRKKGFGEVYNIPFVISISFPSDDNCKFHEAKKILVRFTTYLS
jgi:hypothetical protein